MRKGDYAKKASPFEITAVNLFVSLFREEGAVSLGAYFGKRAGRRFQRVRQNL